MVKKKRRNLLSQESFETLESVNVWQFCSKITFNLSKNCCWWIFCRSTHQLIKSCYNFKSRTGNILLTINQNNKKWIEIELKMPATKYLLLLIINEDLKINLHYPVVSRCYSLAHRHFDMSQQVQYRINNWILCFSFRLRYCAIHGGSLLHIMVYWDTWMEQSHH